MFRKSLLSAITIFLAGQFCLISESVTAGSFTDYIRKECPREYDLYKSAVTEFAIRMKPNVGQCGCDVVGLYYALSRNSMELVAHLEEDAELMQSAARVFGISEELTEALGNAPEAVSTLTILTEHDPRLFRKLSDALSLFSRSDRKKLSKNPNYILYYLLAAAMADAQGSEITSMVKRLKRRIAPGAIDVFSLLYTQTFSVYPHADTDYRFSAADATLGKLGMKNVRAVRPYKAHLALFLPPTEKEIPESQNLNKTEYKQLKEDHINLLVRVFQNISDKYGLPYGLKVVEHIAPHLMDALRFHNNKNQIGPYLDHESGELKMRTEAEIRMKGMKALIASLGIVDAEKFIALIHREPFDYTEWQKTLWEGMSVEQISQMAMKNHDKKQRVKVRNEISGALPRGNQPDCEQALPAV